MATRAGEWSDSGEKPVIAATEEYEERRVWFQPLEKEGAMKYLLKSQ